MDLIDEVRHAVGRQTVKSRGIEPLSRRSRSAGSPRLSAGARRKRRSSRQPIRGLGTIRMRALARADPSAAGGGFSHAAEVLRLINISGCCGRASAGRCIAPRLRRSAWQHGRMQQSSCLRPGGEPALAAARDRANGGRWRGTFLAHAEQRAPQNERQYECVIRGSLGAPRHKLPLLASSLRFISSGVGRVRRPRVLTDVSFRSARRSRRVVGPTAPARPPAAGRRPRRARRGIVRTARHRPVSAARALVDATGTGRARARGAAHGAQLEKPREGAEARWSISSSADQNARALSTRAPFDHAGVRMRGQCGGCFPPRPDDLFEAGGRPLSGGERTRLGRAFDVETRTSAPRRPRTPRCCCVDGWRLFCRAKRHRAGAVRPLVHRQGHLAHALDRGPAGPNKGRYKHYALRRRRRRAGTAHRARSRDEKTES